MVTATRTSVIFLLLCAYILIFLPPQCEARGGGRGGGRGGRGRGREGGGGGALSWFNPFIIPVRETRSAAVNFGIILLNAVIWLSLAWCVKQILWHLLGSLCPGCKKEEDGDEGGCCGCIWPGEDGGEGVAGGRMSREAELMERKRARMAEERGIYVV